MDFDGLKIVLNEEFWSKAEERCNNRPIYNNSHRKEAANQVGFLGEIVAEYFFEQQGIAAEHRDSTRHDYKFPNHLTLDVKTKDRTVRPIKSHECTLPAYNHAHQDADYFLFVSLYRPNKDNNITDIKRFTEAYIVGFMQREEFDKASVFWRKGETDPTNNTKFWTDCFNVFIHETLGLKEFKDVLGA